MKSTSNNPCIIEKTYTELIEAYTYEYLIKIIAKLIEAHRNKNGVLFKYLVDYSIFKQKSGIYAE